MKKINIINVTRDGTTLVLNTNETNTKTLSVYYGECHDCTKDGKTFGGDWNGSSFKLSDPNPTKRLYFFAEDKQNGDIYFGSERKIPLEGSFNFRDLGGYQTKQGKTVVWGELYRSDAFQSITDLDIQYLKGMEIKTIVDLRSKKESEKRPNISWGDIPYYQFDPNAKVARDAGNAAFFTSNDELKIRNLEAMCETTDGQEFFKKSQNTMGKQMKEMVTSESALNAYQNMFSLLLKDNILPLVFHCQGGKDRTGWAAVLILAALGVPDDIIMDDYLLTGICGEQRNVRRMNEYRKYTDNETVLEFLYSLMATRDYYLQSALDEVNHLCSDWNQYLRKYIKLEDTEIEQLQKRFLY